MTSAPPHKIVAHRGASGYAPENTLLAFQTAIDLGCDAVEMDVRVSRDGVPVVIHDRTVNRTTNGWGWVRNKALAKLQRLRGPENQKIPTLQEVIDLCKGKASMIIELKARGTPQPVVELIERNSIAEQVMVASFKPELLSEVRSLRLDLQLGLLFGSYSEQIWKLAESISADYICPWAETVTEEIIRRAHDLELKVYSGPADDKSSFERLVKWNVDEIATNYPKLFLNR